jgi:phosphate starvation-inducible protein PhoH
MAKSDAVPQTELVFENERLLDKVLTGDGAKNVKATLQNTFKVEIHKTISVEDVPKNTPSQKQLSNEFKKAKKEFKKLQNKDKTNDVPLPVLKVAEKEEFEKIKKAIVIIKGGNATNRDIVESVLHILQKELIVRETRYMKELLDRPTRLYQSSDHQKITEQDILSAKNFFENDLLKHHSLVPNFIAQDSKKKTDEEKNKNSARNKWIEQTKSLLKRSKHNMVKKLQINQHSSSLTSMLEVLVGELNKMSTNDFKAEALISDVRIYIDAINERSEERLVQENNKKNDIYRTLSEQEQSELKGAIKQALENENVPAEEDKLKEYAKNAVYKLKDVRISSREFDNIVSDARSDSTPAERFSAKPEDINVSPELKKYALKLEKAGTRSFVPRNESQAKQIVAMQEAGVTLAIGPAGTGKTVTASAYAVSQLDAGRTGHIIILSPMVELGNKSTMGFLPGNEMQKMGPYARQVYRELVDLAGEKKINRWMGFSDLPDPGQNAGPKTTILNEIVNNHPLQLQSLASVRGMTFKKSIVIVDEAQNLRMEDAKAILTRLGEDSQIIFCGDAEQTDIPVRDNAGRYINDLSKMPCLPILMKFADKNPQVRVVKYRNEDIVRSQLTKANVEWFDLMQNNAADIVSEIHEQDQRTMFKNNLNAPPNGKEPTPNGVRLN